MFAQAGETGIWYELSGPPEAPPVVLLHGWGASLETLRSVATCLAPLYRVYALDFPGFGQSPPPPRPWSVGDYTAALHELLRQWNLGPVRIIGHSFGGSVAIMLAAHHPELVDRLILVDSAGIRRPRSLKGELLAGLGQASRAVAALPWFTGMGERARAALASRLGSSDYAVATGTMRETFVRVVNEDLSPLLPHVQASTLLVWGDDDQDTPVADARLMEQFIPDAGLVLFAGAGHYAYLDRPAEFCAVARHFLADPAAAPGSQPMSTAAPGALTTRTRAGLSLYHVILWSALIVAAVAAVVSALLALRALAGWAGGAPFWALLAFVAAVPWALLVLRRQVAFLHVLQLEEYEMARYWAWVRAHPARGRLARDTAISIPAALAILLSVTSPLPAILPVALAACWGVAGAYLLAAARPSRSNKALVYTRKAQAVLALALALAALLALILAWAATRLPLAPTAGRARLLLPGLIAGVWLAGMAAAPAILGGNLVLYPAQAAAKRRLLRRAALLLRARPDLIVVGISGAYGKTSVKEILATLLEARYQVLKTPESYNTPLGIAGVTLRDLRPEHQIFVVEMGSYGPGDVAYLCRLTRPRIGIMTAIGPMHLERFGTVEAIARTDYELIEALPATSGAAIFNNDNEWCRGLAARTSGPQVVRTALAHGPDADLWASGVVTTSDGLQFTIHDRAGQAAPFQVQLLGMHNVTNVLLATAAAMACGMSLHDVARAASRIRPVPHRLQLIRGSGGVTVIDDGYNANPDGMAAGLEVLRDMPGRRKVLVTPGMVELGTREEEEHRKLGRLAAAVCDTVLLVGPRRTRPIVEGLREGGFPAEQAIVVRSAAERDAQLARLAGAGDVVLIANDLPDQYDE